MTHETNFKNTYKTCKDFGFNPEITAETCWNEGYQLGRRRWHWGPAWFVTFQGWINTQRNKVKRFISRPKGAAVQ